MKINNKTLKIVLAVFTALSIALSFFRYNMLTGGAIDALGLYTDKGLGNVFGSLVFILLGLTAVFAFLTKKSGFVPAVYGVSQKISSAVCMLLLIVAGISSVSVMFSSAAPIISAHVQPMAQKPGILQIIETLLIFAAAVYFLFEVLKPANAEKKDGYSVLALLPVLYFAVRTIRLFMNIETQINSSQRSFTLLFLVVVMMFFISEAEYSVPLGELEKTAEANSARAAKYIGFGLAVMELVIIIIIPSIFGGQPDMHTLVFGLSDIAIADFAFVKVLSFKNEH